MLSVLFSILFLLNIFLELHRRNKIKKCNFHISKPLYSVFYITVLAIIAFIIYYIREFIIFLFHDMSFSFTLSDKISLIFSFIYIILIIFQVGIHLYRKKLIKEEIDEIISKNYILQKNGYIRFYKFIEFNIDKLLKFNLRELFFDSKEDFYHISLDYICFRFSDSNKKLNFSQLNTVILLLTQYWVRPRWFYDTMSEDEYHLFEYCEKKLFYKLKPYIPLAIFDYHNLLKKSNSIDWKQPETYLIIELTNNYDNYKNYTDISKIIRAKKKIINKLDSAYEQEQQELYLTSLIEYMKNNEICTHNR